MHLQLIPILAQALSLTLGASSQGRVRTDDLGHHPDVSLIGTADLRLSLKRVSWNLVYSPAITQFNLGEVNATRTITNTGSLTATARLGPMTTLGLTETGTYGRQNIQVLAVNSLSTNGQPPSAAGGATSGGTPQPGTSPAIAAQGSRTIEYGFVSTAASLNQRLNRSWNLLAGTMYRVYGELNAAEQPPTLPVSRAVYGNLSLSSQVASRDTITIAATGSRTLTEPSADSLFLGSNVGWLRRLAPNTSLTLALGGVLGRSRDSDGTEKDGVLPYALASLTHRRSVGGNRTSLYATVVTAPNVDSRSGAAYQTLNTNAGADLTRRKLTVSASVFGSSQIQSLGQVSLLASYGVTEGLSLVLDRRRHWSAVAGAYQSWQSYANLPQDNLFFWAVYLGLTYTTGPMPL